MDLLATGREAERKGLLLRALTLYREGLKRAPQSQELKAADRLNAQLEKGKADGSVHINRKQAPSDDPATMLKQAEVFVKYGLTAKAIEHLDALLAKHPSYAPAKALRATLK